MKALVLVAHGSRRKQSNEEVIALAKKLKQHCTEQYTIVYPGFLELASPSIPEGIQLCIDEGASQVTVLPYFLNSGRHVVEDIPALVEQARQSNPESDIRISQHLGASELMLDLLISSANMIK
jgi:sirohydrochlorin ferrochelatase